MPGDESGPEPELPPRDGPAVEHAPSDGPARPDGDDLPTEAELARVAEPATVRHAPRFRAFLTTGALAGAVVALVVTVIVGRDSPVEPDGTAFIGLFEGQGAVRSVMTLAGAAFGALLGGALAAWADRRSLRGGRGTRDDAGPRD
ncbi:histidine kinase [Cellulomonas hominis]